MAFYSAYFVKFFSCHFTFSPGGSAKLTCVCDQNTAEQVIISNFLSVKVMGEDSENLESALGINLSLLMQEVNFLSEKTSSDKKTEGSSVFQPFASSSSEILVLATSFTCEKCLIGLCQTT